MPLFGKKDDKKDGEGLSQKEIDAFKNKNADLIASARPSEPTKGEKPQAEERDAQSENSAGVPNATPGAEGGVTSNESPGGADVGQTANTDGPGGDGSSDDSSETGEASDSNGDALAGLGDDDSLSDDLMDLFTSEEVVDDDLEALTKDLEDLDMNDVLRLALEVSAKLAERFPGR